MSSASGIRVTALWIHPIKSLRGVRVREARVGPLGLDGDRRWMLVDAKGRFITQRERPELARLDVSLLGDVISVTDPQQGTLRVDRLATSVRRDVQVWSWNGTAEVHAPGSEWFARVLGFPVQLVRLPDDVVRAIPPPRGRTGDRVSFADGYPVLLAQDDSLADLQRRIGEKPALPMERFRPNVVVAGGGAWTEDTWRVFRVGPVAFRNVKPCDRCVLTTNDPRTGERGPEPLRTLARFRARDGAVWFGVNLVPESEGWVREGDVLEVLEPQPPWIEPDLA